MKRFLSLAVALSFLFVAAAVTPVIGVELVDAKKAPVGFVKVVEVKDPKTGKMTMEATFDTTAYHLSPVTIHQFLTAYGLDIVDAKKAALGTGWYVRESEVKDPKTGKVTREHTFNSVASSWTASEFHQILSAYGLRLVDAKKAALGTGWYVRESEVKDSKTGEIKTEYVFNDTAQTRTAGELNQILSAYGRQ